MLYGPPFWLSSALSHDHLKVYMCEGCMDIIDCMMCDLPRHHIPCFGEKKMLDLRYPRICDCVIDIIGSAL